MLLIFFHLPRFISIQESDPSEKQNIFGKQNNAVCVTNKFLKTMSSMINKILLKLISIL